MKDRQELLRGLPSVEVVAERLQVLEEASGKPRQVIVESVREALGDLRRSILGGEISEVPGTDEIVTLAAGKLAESGMRGIHKVINATGVIIHTNLGRSLLSREACGAVLEVISSYSSLEIDLISGKRTSRIAYVSDMLAHLIGCEGALVVNNNAAAVMLVLNTLCDGKEVIVSRGELIEIGGSFRLPEIMERSGAKLVEVGTTNKTRIADYEKAVTRNTGAILKVHRSNFLMSGYVESVSCADLAGLARERNLLLFDDLGSGALYEFQEIGLEREPLPQDSLKCGADLVTFSGDKLMGGPQAGIVVGRGDLTDRCKSNPMSRALRVDKVTLAALQSTLELYMEPELLCDRLPTLRMMSTPAAEIERRAARVADAVRSGAGGRAGVEVEPGESRIGGGALPGSAIPTYVVIISPADMSAGDFLYELRKCSVPVIARISEDRVLIDLRTVDPSEDELITESISGVFARTGRDERS